MEVKAGFPQQRARLNAERQNNLWNLSTGGQGGRVSRGADVIKNIRTYDFNNFAKEAYDNPRGYAIRDNPHTGERELFVAGTRTLGDWGGNIKEAARRKLEIWSGRTPRPVRYRIQYENYLANVARKNNVDVIYGHSRGAALVNDIPYDGARKIGLDGASILSFKPYSIDNYRQGQAFDALIGGKYRLLGRNQRTFVNKERVPLFIRNKTGYKRLRPPVIVNPKYHYIYKY